MADSKENYTRDFESTSEGVSSSQGRANHFQRERNKTWYNSVKCD